MKNSDHQLFFSSDVTESTALLDENETQHAVSVLRINKGDSLQITNGHGLILECEFEGVCGKKACCVIKEKRIVPRTKPEVTLLLGLPDKDHFETVLEHATALGVARVVPLIMDHCRKPWWTGWEKSSQRFTYKMIVSMKQCLYPYYPLLDSPTELSTILGGLPPLLVAHQDGITFDDSLLENRTHIASLIGPPGGFSEDEAKMLQSKGARFVKIAHNRLRTELAATVMTSRLVSS